jgi:hypothetical protein
MRLLRACHQDAEVAVGPWRSDLFKRRPLCYIGRPAQAPGPRPKATQRTQSAAELLRTANRWQQLLDSGAVGSKSQIARREGLTRARVTQIMNLLRLAPTIQRRLLDSADSVDESTLTERALRPIARLPDRRKQISAFRALSPSHRIARDASATS